jgi:hypothetical protein
VHFDELFWCGWVVLGRGLVNIGAIAGGIAPLKQLLVSLKADWF